MSMRLAKRAQEHSRWWVYVPCAFFVVLGLFVEIIFWAMAVNMITTTQLSAVTVFILVTAASAPGYYMLHCMHHRH